MGKTATSPLFRIHIDYNFEKKNKSTSKINSCPNTVRRGRLAGSMKTSIKIYHNKKYELLLIKNKKHFESKEFFLAL